MEVKRRIEAFVRESMATNSDGSFRDNGKSLQKLAPPQKVHGGVEQRVGRVEHMDVCRVESGIQ